MVTAVYPGTFDPITNGHVDIAKRCACLFDKTIIAIADNTNKSPLFSTNERIVLARKVLSNLDNIVVTAFTGLTINFAVEQGAKVIIRGIRAVSDFDYEFQMAGMNRQLVADIETVFLVPSEECSYIAASLVRTVALLKGDVSKFVNPIVATALKEKFS